MPTVDGTAEARALSKISVFSYRNRRIIQFQRPVRLSKLKVDFPLTHSTAVSCNISPLANRAGLSTSMLSTTFVVP